MSTWYTSWTTEFNFPTMPHSQVVSRSRQAAELRPVFDDVHLQVSVRAPHPHALHGAVLRVQRVRTHLRAGQLSYTVSFISMG